MKKDNFLNHYNEVTELSVYEKMGDDDDDRKEKLKTKIDAEKKEFKSNITYIFSLDFKNLNFSRDMLLYLTLGLFFIISLIELFFKKNFLCIMSVIILLYATIYCTSKLCSLQDTRYSQIAVWNLFNSSTMFVKGIYPNFLKNNDYAKIIVISNIFYIVSLILAIMPVFSYLPNVILIGVLISYFLSFCNRDIEIVKQSTSKLCLCIPILIIITSIIGSILYGGNGINFTGYTTWLMLYYFNYLIKDFHFKDM